MLLYWTTFLSYCAYVNVTIVITVNIFFYKTWEGKHKIMKKVWDPGTFWKLDWSSVQGHTWIYSLNRRYMNSGICYRGKELVMQTESVWFDTDLWLRGFLTCLHLLSPRRVRTSWVWIIQGLCCRLDSMSNCKYSLLVIFHVFIISL